MLDVLESLGFDFDSLDMGGSLSWQQKLFPGTKPQSLCSWFVHQEKRIIVWLIGRDHCHRSHARYHSGDEQVVEP